MDKSVATFFQNRLYRFGPRPLFSEREGAGPLSRTWEEVGREVEILGRALLAARVEPGETIPILADHRSAGAVADLAIQSVGGVSAPLPDLPSERLCEILRKIRARLLFAGDDSQVERVSPLRNELPDLEQVIRCPGNKFPSEPALGIPASRFYDRIERIRPGDPSTFLWREDRARTHEEVLSETLATAQRLPMTGDDLLLSLLPLSHPFGRTAGLFAPLSAGARIGFGSGGRTIPGDLPEIRPTLLLTTPEVIEKFFAEIRNSVDRRSLPIRQLFEITNEGRKRPLLKPFYENIFTKKIRRNLGGEIRTVILAEGNLDADIATFLETLGIGTAPPSSSVTA